MTKDSVWCPECRDEIKALNLRLGAAAKRNLAMAMRLHRLREDISDLAKRLNDILEQSYEENGKHEKWKE